MDNADSVPAKLLSLDAELTELTRKRDALTRKINKLRAEKEELRDNYNFQKSTEVDSTLTFEDFPWSKEAQAILKDTFQLQSFRTQQLSAINATLSKKDLLLIMPTGGGKTLCYQLPAMIDKGMTLVVSPLIALMHDQLISLKRRNINAVAMTSATRGEVKTRAFQYMSKGVGPAIKMMYVTPEWLAKSKTLMSGLQHMHEAGKLDRIAIDEVHCCSQWGHDFRPDYKFLGLLRSMFSGVPIMGLTATATTAVLKDIQNMLDLSDCAIMRAPFDRPNLEFKVTSKPDTNEEAYEYLAELLSETFKEQSGIIYTATIKDCVKVRQSLKQRGLKVRCYHAELEDDIKAKTHQEWLDNEIQAVVATVAFGMGIDKPDVRFVVHFSVPKSMETLYQESGRAGRDGSHSQCIVMFKLGDYIKNSEYSRSKVESKNATAVLEYCLDIKQCRHYLIGLHFEETEVRRCQTMCDNCVQDCNIDAYDVKAACNDVHKIIEVSLAADKNLTAAKLVSIWMKPTNKYGVKEPIISKPQAEHIIGNLLLQKCLIEDKKYTPYQVYSYIRCGQMLNSIPIYMFSDSLLAQYLIKGTKKRPLELVDESESDDDCLVVEANSNSKLKKLN